MGLLYTIIKSLAVFISIYRSFKALRHKQVSNRRGWLQFWLTVVCLQQAEGFADWICFWFPFYNEIKALAALWLIVAGTWGGAILYQTSVRPFIAVHERFVDYYIVGYGTFICRVFAWLISKIWNGSVALTRLILMRSTTKEQVKKSNDNMLRQREPRRPREKRVEFASDMDETIESAPSKSLDSSYILPVAAHGTTYRKAAKALERERLRSYGPRQPSLPSSAQRAIPNRAAYQLGSPSIYHPASNARQPATPTAYNNSRKKVTPALARIRDQNPATSPRAATSQLAGWNAPTSAHALPLHRHPNPRLVEAPSTPMQPFLVSPLAGRSTRRANVERVPMFPELGLLEDDQDGPLAASTPARPNRKSDKSYTTKGMPSPFLVDGGSAAEYTPFSLSLGQHPAELSSSLPGVPGDFPTPVVRKRPAVDEELPVQINRKEKRPLSKGQTQKSSSSSATTTTAAQMSDNRKRAKHRAALLQQKRSHTAIDKMANETSDIERKRPRSNSEINREKQAELAAAAAAAAAMVNTIESTTTDMKEKENEPMADTTPVLPKRPVITAKIKDTIMNMDTRQELDSTPDNVIEPSPASVIMINDTTEDEEDEDEEDGDENEIDEDAEETNEPITIDLPNQAVLSSESDVDDERKDATYTEEQAAAEMSESDFDIINPTRRRSKSRYLSLPKIRFSPDTTRSKPPSSTSIDASANTMDTEQQNDNNEGNTSSSSATTPKNRKKSHQRQSIKSNS